MEKKHSGDIYCIVAIFCGAFFLDQLLPRGCFLLGLCPLFAILFFQFFPEGPCAVISFSFGLLMDSIYISIPFGFSAFYGLLTVYFFKIFSRSFRLEKEWRWTYSIALFTLLYYLFLGKTMAAVHWPSIPFSIGKSIFYNVISWKLWIHFRSSKYFPH
jgi:hypothetical protein